MTNLAASAGSDEASDAPCLAQAGTKAAPEADISATSGAEGRTDGCTGAAMLTSVRTCSNT